MCLDAFQLQYCVDHGKTSSSSSIFSHLPLASYRESPKSTFPWDCNCPATLHPCREQCSFPHRKRHQLLHSVCPDGRLSMATVISCCHLFPATQGQCLPLPTTFSHNHALCSACPEPDLHVCCLLPSCSTMASHSRHCTEHLSTRALHSGHSHQPEHSCSLHTDDSPISPNHRCQCHGPSLSITHSGHSSSHSYSAGTWLVTSIPASKPDP